MEKINKVIQILEEELNSKKKTLEYSMEYKKADFNNNIDMYSFERNMISDLVVQTQKKTEIKTMENMLFKIKAMLDL